MDIRNIDYMNVAPVRITSRSLPVMQRNGISRILKCCATLTHCSIKFQITKFNTPAIQNVVLTVYSRPKYFSARFSIHTSGYTTLLQADSPKKYLSADISANIEEKLKIRNLVNFFAEDFN